MGSRDGIFADGPTRGIIAGRLGARDRFIWLQVSALLRTASLEISGLSYLPITLVLRRRARTARPSPRLPRFGFRLRATVLPMRSTFRLSRSRLRAA